MTSLRLVFMATPEFAIPTLAALNQAGHEVVCVYTQPPRPAGRGGKIRLSAVHATASRQGIEVRTPPTLDTAEHWQAFAELEADAAVVVAYGLILPPPILGATRFGCLNLHASLLPRWRGAAPIPRAIMAGDEETGVTIMLMDERLDTGPMLLSERVPITPRTTAESLEGELARRGAALMVAALAGLVEGRIKPRPQSASGVTYARKLSPDEGRLDWRWPALRLERLVRGLTPEPGAWFEHGGTRIKVHAAEVVAEAQGTPGEVLDEAPTVACGGGGLRLLEVQRAGKARLPAADFLRGFPLPPGTVLACPQPACPPPACPQLA